jgi:hypothetical protein
MNEFVAAIAGAVVGALAVFLAELWRQVLEGVSAARIIYAEVTNNSSICDQAAEGMVYRSLSADVWQEHATKVVPLLTDEAAKSIAIVYLGIPMAQQLLSAILQGAKPDKEQLKDIGRDFRKAELWIQHIFLKKSRLRLLHELTLGRVTGPTEKRIDQVLDEEDAGRNYIR